MTITNMRTRYIRKAWKRARCAAIAALIAVALAAYSLVFASSGEPEQSLAFACCAIVSVFFAAVETSEAIRCMRIAARWFSYERKQP